MFIGLANLLINEYHYSILIHRPIARKTSDVHSKDVVNYLSPALPLFSILNQVAVVQALIALQSTASFASTILTTLSPTLLAFSLVEMAQGT